MREGFDERGKFAPGNKLAPGVGGSYKKAILTAIEERWDGPAIVALIDEAYAAAKSTRSSKGMIALAELVLGYILGKPKQALEIGTDDSRTLLAAILSDRTPLLPPRQGVIVDEGDTLALPDAIVVDTTMDDGSENTEETQDD